MAINGVMDCKEYFDRLSRLQYQHRYDYRPTIYPEDYSEKKEMKPSTEAERAEFYRRKAMRAAA